MSHEIEDSVVIEAAPETLWRWTVEDVELERSWRNINGTGVQTLERLDGEGPVEVGSRFRGTVKIGPGKPQAYVNEVTELEPGRRIAWKTVEAEGPLLGHGSYEMTPVEGGTRFDIGLDYPPRTWVGRLQRPAVLLVGGRIAPRLLARLKELVESERPAAGTA